jgi:carbonic anhydrase
VSGDVIGSLEYAASVVGSCLIVVLGHTSCGAVKAACDNTVLGEITGIMNKIKPAISKEKAIIDNRTGDNAAYVNSVARHNVNNSVEEILANSDIIKQLVQTGKVGIVPAMYDVATGKVSFYETEYLHHTMIVNQKEVAA